MSLPANLNSDTVGHLLGRKRSTRDKSTTAKMMFDMIDVQYQAVCNVLSLAFASMSSTTMSEGQKVMKFDTHLAARVRV